MIYRVFFLCDGKSLQISLDLRHNPKWVKREGDEVRQANITNMSDAQIDNVLLSSIEYEKEDNDCKGKPHVIERVECSMDGIDWFLCDRDIK